MDDWWDHSGMVPRPVLHDFQGDALDRVRRHWGAGKRHVLLQMPTGAGKTVVAAHAMTETAARGGECLFIVSRRELVRQACQKLAAYGTEFGVVMAGVPADPGRKVQVASKETLHSRGVLRKTMPLPRAKLVVVDEARHSLSPAWLALLARYKDAYWLGLDATPARGDGQGLGRHFDEMVCGATYRELLAGGHLVPIEVFAPHVPDLKGVKINRSGKNKGDYDEGQLEKVMNKPKLVGDVVSHWKRLAPTRLTLVFASGIKHSMHLRDQFLAAGIRAAHLDGASPTGVRDATLEDFERRRVQVLCSCDLFNEGLDVPAASCAVLARPTRSVVGYRQRLGRIMRPYPGKISGVLIDHAGAVYEHGMPDEEGEWSLADGYKPKAGGDKPRESKPHLCPQCGFMFRGSRVCPNCETTLEVRPAAVECAKGELVKVSHQHIDHAGDHYEDREKYWRVCLAVMARKGRTLGAAAQMYRGRYKDWPDPGFSPYPQRHQWKSFVADVYPGFLGRKAAEVPS
jgi:DNA repair protein RadD